MTKLFADLKPWENKYISDITAVKTLQIALIQNQNTINKFLS